MLMIRPLPCARRYGSTSRVTRTNPKKLVSKSCCAWATELSSAAPMMPKPPSSLSREGQTRETNK